MELEKKIPKVFKAPKKCINRVPDEILNDDHLRQAIRTLPPNYNFEIEKTVWRIRSINAKLVGLQMPEGGYVFTNIFKIFLNKLKIIVGLLLYGTTIVDIIRKFTDAEALIMADVTYGACCIDDYTAKALKVDLLIHYGHSCLIPINQMFHNDLSFLYVFVNIEIDLLHCFQTISLNFPDKSAKSIFLVIELSTRLEIILLISILQFLKITNSLQVSTIQFLPSLHSICSQLQENGYQTFLPQSKPLSPGEILGCTAPKIQHACDSVIIYIGDGRFHLEAMMIANPHIDAFKYDPYTKRFTKESYDFKKLLSNRQKSIQMCSLKNGGTKYKIGLILGL